MAKKTVSKKKSTGKAVAVRKSGGAVVDWKQQLRDAAKEEADRVPSGSGNRISLRKNQQFRMQGSDIGDDMEAVIVFHVYNRFFFDKDYDEDNPGPPACFAHSISGKNMAPVENSPNKQNEICEDCWANQWKSDKREKGKACKEKHALAILLKEDLDEEDPELKFLTLPVTTGAAFRKYVKKLADNEVPSFAVITSLSFDKSAENQKLDFELVEEIPEEARAMILEKVKAAKKVLMEEPSFEGYEPAKGAKAAKGKKGVTSKKKSRLS